MSFKNPTLAKAYEGVASAANLTPVAEKQVPGAPRPEKLLETKGFGKFEYKSGIIYEGQWCMFDAERKKHGEGILRFPGTFTYQYSLAASDEEYRGSF